MSGFFFGMGNLSPEYAVWEIHPVMALHVGH
jgi:hypothetical protein